jgi:hypothetical protein
LNFLHCLDILPDDDIGFNVVQQVVVVVWSVRTKFKFDADLAREFDADRASLT